MENLKLSERVKLQLEKFDSYKSSLEEILQKIEIDYQIKIFYASETGSRGLGIDVEESDFDVTGFFVPINELEYYKIIRKYDRTIKCNQEKIIINNIVYEIDVELWDFKEWLRSKIINNFNSCDYWFESLLNYRNLYPDIIESVRKYIIPPYIIYWGKSKSGIGYNEKDIKLKGECLNKSLMNVLTNLFQYTHYQIYSNFPIFNILEEIDYLMNNKNKIVEDKFLTENEFEILEKSIEVYLNLFERKKLMRKSCSDSIPGVIYDLIKMIENKFKTHKKKSELEKLIDEETAQRWFEDALKRK